MVGLKRGREGKTINYYKMRKNTEIFHLLHGITEFQSEVRGVF
jgi:hypothetical protein